MAGVSLGFKILSTSSRISANKEYFGNWNITWGGWERQRIGYVGVISRKINEVRARRLGLGVSKRGVKYESCQFVVKQQQMTGERGGALDSFESYLDGDSLE